MMAPAMERILRPGEQIEKLAARVWKYLHANGHLGSARAVKQAKVAAGLGVTTRLIQRATLELNRQGRPVVSSCVEPFGIFVAVSDEELGNYDAQLHSRLVGDAMRRGFVRRMRRESIASMPVEPTGQRRLFA